MNKLAFLATLLMTTSLFAEQDSICVDKMQVEQTIATLKHIATALASLAQRVQVLLDKEQETTLKRSIDFGAWQNMVDQQSRPTREDSTQENNNTDTYIDDNQE